MEPRKYSIEIRAGRRPTIPQVPERNGPRMLKLKVRRSSPGGSTGRRLGQVVSQAELISLRGGWKHAGRGVVCASGCFDLLHPGHSRFLEQARAFGDVLVVAIESDEAVRARFAQQDRNTSARPFNPAAERAEVLAALAAVDFVTVVEGESPVRFLARLSPEIVVTAAGRDATADREPSDLERLACKVVRVAPEPGYSTTLLIGRILESHS